MKKTLFISGMRCAHCAAAAEKALRAVAGVSDVAIDVSSGTAVVEAADTVSAEQMKAAVAGAGYTVTGIGENA